VSKSPLKESLCYITVGTGIGIGLVINGKCVHGMMHPEGGHARVPLLESDKFEGVCPFHKNCLEGLCTNVAIQKRLGLASVEDVAKLGDDHEIWNTLAYYLGTFCANLYLAVSVERIIIGGGVMNRTILFAKI